MKKVELKPEPKIVVLERAIEKIRFRSIFRFRYCSSNDCSTQHFLAWRALILSYLVVSISCKI
uniref:Uncharacterized protein n=1 Tax=Utricularia reniformis TaxID=192314 RepID=A0A1Y0B409_9LAMI|nr:hypothetical protein AEK19_MT1960 [Utricularia reniformis]ART32123.1 hypothetical protein AEK19_MT1960 [Utricularia reniformis]